MRPARPRRTRAVRCAVVTGCDVACVEPIFAYRHPSAGIRLFSAKLFARLTEVEGFGGWKPLLLPCGRCIGCRMSVARDWAIRCTFEAQDWKVQSFVTFTYRDDVCPKFLRKDHLSGAIKRLRARLDSPIKFFACGEYGEEKGRPHYHALLFGVRELAPIQASWPFGFVQVKPVTPERIAYTAGYVSKKFDTMYQGVNGEVVDEETGEILIPQREFRLMSRGGRTGLGIGGAAKRFTRSWRKDAIWQGNPVPVPRYFHEAWKASASEAEIEALRQERLLERPEVTHESLAAAKARLEVLLEHKQSKRRST